MSQNGHFSAHQDKTLRRHYWSPRREGVHFVDEVSFLYPFHLPMENGWWSDWHKHEDFGEIFYWGSGHSVLCTTDQNFICTSLRAIWIPPGVEHEWYVPQNAIDRAIFVHTSAVADRERFCRLHMVEVSPLLRELLFSITDAPVDFSSEKGQRMGKVLLDCFEDAPLASSPLNMPHSHRLVELCAQAVLEPGSPVSYKDWSEILHVSPKTLARMFLRETGMSMGQWVKLMRLLHAQQKIEKGASVTEAALDSGYTSVSAFIHAFKKNFGSTPGNKRG